MRVMAQRGSGRRDKRDRRDRRDEWDQRDEWAGLWWAGSVSAFGFGEEGGEVAVAEDTGDEFGRADIFDVGEAESGFCESG
jgi:hypothetical protein